MRQLFLVDNSALQRVHRSEAVAAALAALLNRGDLAGCLPQLLEEGYSARSADEHALILDLNQRAKVFLAPEPSIAEIALGIQSRLFDAGIGRSVGVSDVQIAATAIAHSRSGTLVTVVHYDADFENVARVLPGFRHEWVVPRGSLA